MFRPPFCRTLCAFLSVLTLALGGAGRGAVMVGADNPNVPAPRPVEKSPLVPEAPDLILPGQSQQQESRDRLRVIEADARLVQARRFFDAGDLPSALAELRRLDKELPFNPAVKLALADALMKSGQAGPALEEAKAAAELAPEDPTFRLLLSQAYTQTGDFEQALREVERCLARNPTNPSARLNKGLLLNKLGRDKETIEYFKREVEKEPDYLAGHNMLGVVYYARADYTNALQHFDHMMRIAPAEPGGAVNAGLSLLAMNKPREALDRFRAIVKQDPLNPEGYGFSGLCLERLREPEKAAQMYKQAIYVDPKYQDGYTMLAGLFLAQDKLEEAEKVLRQGIEKTPGSTSMHRLLSDLLRRQGREDEASQIMLAALDKGFLEPANWRVFLLAFQKVLEKANQGPVAIPPGRLTNNLERAEWHYKVYHAAMTQTNVTAGALNLVHAALLDGTRPEYFNDLGSLSVPYLGSRAAIPFFMAALYLRPDYEAARRNLVNNVGRVEQAEREVRLQAVLEHVKIQPDQPDIRFSAGLLLAQLNRLEDALPHFARAVELQPRNFNYRMDYAKALFLAGRIDDSLKQTLAALVDSPSNPLIQYQVAWIVLQKPLPGQLDLDLAETEMRKAADSVGRRDPRYPWQMAKVLALRGQWEQAMTAAQLALEIAAELKQEEWMAQIRSDLAGLQEKKAPPKDTERGLTHGFFQPPVPLIPATATGARAN
jgi:tetratricopeptide (TPR) repeat protein